ncbi:MAG: hypothetical protein ACE5HL_04755 [Terriglobia bacterium]
MAPRDDNDFSPFARERGSRRGSSTLWYILAAVLAGNGLYFLLLFPHLPASWQHQPFALDRGLGLDFLLCLGAYGLIRLAQAAGLTPRATRR